MTTQEIAKVILNLRETRMSSFILSGELREKLGFEGYGEAMRRRWLIADTDSSGMVQVTNSLGLIEEIRQIAECEPCAKSPGGVTYGQPALGSNPVEYPSGNATEQKMGNEAPKSDDEGEAVKKTWSGDAAGDKGEVVAKSPGDVSYKSEAAHYALTHAARHHLQEIAPPATGGTGIGGSAAAVTSPVAAIGTQNPKSSVPVNPEFPPGTVCAECGDPNPTSGGYPFPALCDRCTQKAIADMAANANRHRVPPRSV